MGLTCTAGCVAGVQSVVQQVRPPHDPPAHAHWRETVRVRPVRAPVLAQRRALAPRPHPHARAPRLRRDSRTTCCGGGGRRRGGSGGVAVVRRRQPDVDDGQERRFTAHDGSTGQRRFVAFRRPLGLAVNRTLHASLLVYQRPPTTIHFCRRCKPTSGVARKR